MPGTKSYAKSVNNSNSIADNLNKIVVFMDSFIRGIRVREFNEFIKNGYTRFNPFPGANSKTLLHYVNRILENVFYNTAVLHVGVHDLLQKSSLSVKNLLSNLIHAKKEYRMSGIEKIFFFCIALNRRISTATIKRVNEKIAALCKEK